jgi:hypothetical protein
MYRIVILQRANAYVDTMSMPINTRLCVYIYIYVYYLCICMVSPYMQAKYNVHVRHIMYTCMWYHKSLFAFIVEFMCIFPQSYSRTISDWHAKYQAYVYPRAVRHTCTYAHLHIHTYTQRYAENIHTYMYTCTYAFIHACCVAQ